MQKLLATLFLSVVVLTRLYAQSDTNHSLFGSYIDINGQLIHSYADQDYEPPKSVTLSFNSMADFAPGTYYGLDGKKTKGRLLQGTSKEDLLFKKDGLSEEEFIKLKALKAISIGADSFIVATGFTVYGQLGIINTVMHNHVLLQHIGNTDKFIFFKYANSGTSAHFLVRRKNSEELISLPLAHNAFVEKAKSLFDDYPKLIELLDQKKIGSDDIASLMRFIQYTDALQEHKPIGYTAGWEITENAKKQSYYSFISLQDQRWKLDFYNKSDQRIFTVYNAYEQPGKNDGEASWYYNGSDIVRKTRKFIKGEADKKYSVYHRNGKLHYTIAVSESGKLRFEQVASASGQAQLDASGSGTEEFNDAAANRTITRTYKNHVLLSSYYVDKEGRKIYQLTNKAGGMRALQSYNKKVREHLTYPDWSITKGEEGIVLIRFLVAPNGEVEESSIIRGVAQGINNKAFEMAGATNPMMEFNKGKHDKENVYQEIIVPFSFSLLRKSSNSYYYYNPGWMHPMHHIHHPVMPPVRPPIKF